MAYKLVETKIALQDLEQILNYITINLSNSKAASDFVGNVEKCYANLKEMPLMYEQCRNSRLFTLGYRKAVIKNYVLIYKIDEINKTVYIMRFFYGRQNYIDMI